jgi:hypothetical protein
MKGQVKSIGRVVLAYGRCWKAESPFIAALNNFSLSPQVGPCRCARNEIDQWFVQGASHRVIRENSHKVFAAQILAKRSI